MRRVRQRALVAAVGDVQRDVPHHPEQGGEQGDADHRAEHHGQQPPARREAPGHLLGQREELRLDGYAPTAGFKSVFASRAGADVLLVGTWAAETEPRVRRTRRAIAGFTGAGFSQGGTQQFVLNWTFTPAGAAKPTCCRAPWISSSRCRVGTAPAAVNPAHEQRPAAHPRPAHELRVGGRAGRGLVHRGRG